MALALVFVAAAADESRLYRAAQTAFNDKLYDVAERQLTEFLQQFPTSERAERATLWLGQCQVQLGKWRAAIATLEPALTRWPDKMPDSFRFWLAEAFARGNEWAKAAAQYTEVVEKYPRGEHRPMALYGLALAQFKQAQFGEAAGTLEQLEKVLTRERALSDLALETELLRGQVELARGKFDRAAAALDNVIQKAAEKNVAYRAHLWRGESLARQQQPDDALKHFALIVDAFQAKTGKPVDAPLAAQAWFAQGWVHWQAGQFDLAAESYRHVLAQATLPELKRAALVKLGEALVRAGKINEGVAQLKEFLTTHPGDELAGDVQIACGDLLLGANQYAAALAEYTALIQQHAKSPFVPKATYNAGWCAWQLQHLPEAAQWFQRAVELARAPALVADALGQFAAATGSYEQLLRDHPRLPTLDRATFQLAEAQRRDGKLDAAAQTFHLLVRKHAGSAFAPEAQFSLGQLAVIARDESAARQAYEKVLADYPTTAWAREAALAIGESFYRQKRYPEAQAHFDQLVAGGLDTELAQRAFYHRGWCLAQQKQPDKTLAEFTEFLKQHPQATLAGDVQFWIANHYLTQKDYLKAEEQFQSLARTYPSNTVAAAAQYYAGRTAYLRQDYKAAISAFEAVVKNFPESTWRCDARFGQGDALTELGQFEDALAVFDNVTRLCADTYLAGDAWGRKGDCQFTLNRFADAAVSYQKALEAGRDAAARHQAMFKLGQCSEKQNQLNDAVQLYGKVIYEAIGGVASNEPPERFWSCKAARAAATVSEQQQQWREAITFYLKLAVTCPDLKPLAEDRIRKIRVERGIFFP